MEKSRGNQLPQRRAKPQKPKAHRTGGPLAFRVPDDDLLSHGNPHYHRRAAVSRSCSGWEGVVPAGCGRQALTGGRTRIARGRIRKKQSLDQIGANATINRTEPISTHGYGVKPHGQLVPVSSRHYCPSTPGLSTWWSATTLQGDQVPGRSHLQARFPLRCFQRLSLPYVATRRCDWRHNRYTSGTSTPVLSY